MREGTDGATGQMWREDHWVESRFAHTVGGNIAYSNVSFLPSLYVFIWKMGMLVSASQQISGMI